MLFVNIFFFLCIQLKCFLVACSYLFYVSVSYGDTSLLCYKHFADTSSYG